MLEKKRSNWTFRLFISLSSLIKYIMQWATNQRTKSVYPVNESEDTLEIANEQDKVC